MVLRLSFDAWREQVAHILDRRQALAAKFLARYLNAALAKTFLAWAGHTSREVSARRELLSKAGAFLSGRQVGSFRLRPGGLLGAS